jgi:hypothetical protein
MDSWSPRTISHKVSPVALLLERAPYHLWAHHLGLTLPRTPPTQVSQRNPQKRGSQWALQVLQRRRLRPRPAARRLDVAPRAPPLPPLRWATHMVSGVPWRSQAR